MSLLGTIVNGGAIIIGSLLGLIFRNISEKMKTTVLQGIGLVVIIIGIGVAFSVAPVVIYQGLIALFATQIHMFVPQALLDAMILEITATGGILIIGIGVNIMKAMKIRVANMLPSLLVAVCSVAILHMVNF